MDWDLNFVKSKLLFEATKSLNLTSTYSRVSNCCTAVVVSQKLWLPNDLILRKNPAEEGVRPERAISI